MTSIMPVLSNSPYNVRTIVNELRLLIEVNNDLKGVRTPLHIILLIDTSGSMGTEAQNGDQESQGLTILDIVKHACKTIIKLMSTQDKVSIVSFNSNANCVFELTTMDENGKTNAEDALNSLVPGGQTNIWDGLNISLNHLNENKQSNVNSVVLLLTDGQPNLSPPRGENHSLKQKLDEFPDLKVSINTFGFGYNLDSNLLNDLSKTGNGQYAFIPDGSFVGTAFVNSISNLLVNYANVVVKVENLPEGFVVPEYENEVMTASWGIQIPLGILSYQQSKTVLITLPNAASGINVSVELTTVNGEKKVVSSEALLSQDVNQFKVQEHRTNFITEVSKAINLFDIGQQDEAKSVIQHLITNIKEHQESQLSVDILADLEGQVTEAFSRPDWFRKWGKHYLLSLINAHHLQQCNNFKDPGVQNYGGELFGEIRDDAEKIFVSLPPPIPTGRTNVYNANSVAVATPVDMSAYYNAGGGCFDGNGLVDMYDGTKVKVMNIKQGDKLSNGAIVKYVVKTEVSKKSPIILIDIGNILITPWHPINNGLKWIFPAEIATANSNFVKYYSHEQVPYLYNFVLDNGTHVIIDGVKAITLAHGIVDDIVTKHDYYGTEKVVDDYLKNFGSNNGNIVIPADSVEYDRNGTQYVVGIKMKEVISC